MPALEMAQENGSSWPGEKKKASASRRASRWLESRRISSRRSGGTGGRDSCGDNCGCGSPWSPWDNHSRGLCSRRKTSSMAVNGRTRRARIQQSRTRERGCGGASDRTACGIGATISPKATAASEELGVDVSKIRGTGPDGDDHVRRCAGFWQWKGRAASAGMEALSQVARLMAERTAQSWTSVPHFFLVRDVAVAN